MLSLLLAATLVAQSTPAPTPSPQPLTITGKLQLISSKLGEEDGKCFGTGGFSDVAGEIPVVIKDGAGKILAISKTEPGKKPKGDRYERVICNFEFESIGVPDSDFYTIEVGRRGSLSYSRADLVKLGGRVEFYLSL
jgi:hypothetical protein